jgi:hypothetical protein
MLCMAFQRWLEYESTQRVTNPLLITEHDHREFKIKQNQRITKVRLENMNSYVSNQVQLVLLNVTIYCIRQTIKP